jgi:hypothetical protein
MHARLSPFRRGRARACRARRRCRSRWSTTRGTRIAHVEWRGREY